MWFVIVVVALVVGLWAWHFYCQSQPLTEQEIVRVAQRRRRRAIDAHYRFSKHQAPLDRAFKASMKPDGAFHAVDYPVEAALSIVASHLKYKKHEWVVLLICRDRRAIGLWCNKGPDATVVWPTIDLEQIAARARRLGADTVIRAHNHPNSHGANVTLLAPSEQDLYSAEHVGALFVGNALNFIDVVCERGRWLAYAERYVDSFHPLPEITAGVLAVNGTAGSAHRQLRRELR